MLLTNYHEFIPQDVCPASEEYQEWEVVFLNFEKALENKWEEIEKAKQAKRDKKWEEYFERMDNSEPKKQDKDPQEAKSWKEYVELGGADATDEIDENHKPFESVNSHQIGR